MKHLLLAFLAAGLVLPAVAQESETTENRSVEITVERDDEDPDRERRSIRIFRNGDEQEMTRDGDEVTVVVNGDTLRGDEKRQWLDENEWEYGNRFTIRGTPGGLFFRDSDDDELEFDRMFDRSRPFMRELRSLPNRFARLGDDFEVFSTDLAATDFPLTFDRSAFDKEVRELDREARRLAREIRRAEPADKERLEAELDELLAKTFTRKQELRQEQVDRLEEQLREARERMNERKTNSKEIIERRKRELLGERSVYDW